MSNEGIQILLEKDEAEAIQNDLSDFLCWIRGFKAGGGDYPFNTIRIADLNAEIKNLIQP